MKNKLLGQVLVCCVALSLAGCFAIETPVKLSDSHFPRRTGVYRQESSEPREEEPSKAPAASAGKNEATGVAASENPSSAGQKKTGGDVLLPRPLQNGEHQHAVSSDELISSNGTLPSLSGGTEKSPADNLNKLEANEVVKLDYEQVDLRQILEEIADSLGITLIIDPSIHGKVTMRTSPVRPLHKKDLWSLLQLLMSEAGLSLEKEGKFYHATGKPILLPEEIGTLNKGHFGKDAGRTLQIIALQHVSQKVVVPVLSALVEPRGKILAMPNLNVIGVIAPSYVQQRILTLLPLLDADPFKYRGIRLFHLQHAKAKVVGKELEKIVNLIEGEKATYRVLALDRINSLLVVSPPERGFKQVEQWVHILDSRSESDVEQVFVYSVKNLKAKALAATLTDTFRSNSKEQQLTVAKDRGSQGKEQKEKKISSRLKSRGKRENSGKKEESARKNPASTSEKGQSQHGVAADIKLKIVADEDTNSLLVRSTPEDYRKLLQTISQLDTPPLEVMCNIVIAEVLLSQENQFGIDWYLLSKYGDALLGTPFDTTDGYTIPGAENRNPFETHWETTGSFTKQGLVLQGVGGGSVAMVLNALATVGNLKVLSRPSILVRNNQEAVIKVGTEEPILTSVTNSDIIANGQTAITNDVQYRDTGIILTVKPHITKDGIINMDVKQEISKLGDNRTVYDLPSFDSSKIKTSVVVRNGTAIILGGIIRSHIRLEKNGLPILGDLPLLGPLFATTKNEESRYELVLIIVPEIVDPQKNNDGLVRNFFYQMRKVYKLLDEQIGTKNFLSGE